LRKKTRAIGGTEDNVGVKIADSKWVHRRWRRVRKGTTRRGKLRILGGHGVKIGPADEILGTEAELHRTRIESLDG